MTRRYSTATSAVALLLATLMARPARAADPPPAPADKGDAAKGGDEAPAEAQPEKPQAVRVTTFLMPHPGVGDEVAFSAQRAVDKGLKKNDKLEMKELSTRLADYAQDIPSDAIEEARKHLKDGENELFALEFGKAKRELSQAIDGLGKVLPFIKKQDLANAMMGLASAQFHDGEKKPAKQTMIRLFTWRPDYALDPKKFPEDLIIPAEEARKETEKKQRGSLEIHAEPVQAEAYVDGRKIGLTPCFAEGLVVGDHYITLKREGYAKNVQVATVSSKAQVLVTVQLERSKKYLIVEQALAALEPQLGKPALDTQIDDLKNTLYVDHAVFIRSRDAGGGKTEVEALLYDTRTKHLLNRAVKSVPSEKAEKSLAPLAGDLYEGVNYNAEVEAPKDAPPPKVKQRTPIYKTWWLWTVVGAVVVGVVLGAALAPRPKDYGDGNWGLRISF